MTAEIAPADRHHPAGLHRFAATASRLQKTAIALGIAWSLLFVLLGVSSELQLYADGSIFSYAVAVEDAWAFHWRNIAGRLFVYLVALLPAEVFVAATGKAAEGVALYGFLFFAAPFIGLAATFAADKSKGHLFFTYACASTACLLPLVFGFPTELWMAHAVFWPTLALCHSVHDSITARILIFVCFLALLFTHAGGLIFAGAILFSLLLSEGRALVYRRAAFPFVVATSIRVAVEVLLRPDDYVAGALHRAASHFFDPGILTGGLMVLLMAALACYAVMTLLWRSFDPRNGAFYAAAVTVCLLVVYWLRFDHALHADNRYYLRTVLLLATPAFGLCATAFALAADHRLTSRLPFLNVLTDRLVADGVKRALCGALLLVALVHAVETAKFIHVWTAYKEAVRHLAAGEAADPAFGDARFVSSMRIDAALNRLSWFSTTQFLSVLVTPGLNPHRLVVDPTASYFWLSCKTATANEAADRAVPVESRRLIRIHACLHR